jgi:hypothetical protein
MAYNHAQVYDVQPLTIQIKFLLCFFVDSIFSGWMWVKAVAKSKKKIVLILVKPKDFLV